MAYLQVAAAVIGLITALVNRRRIVILSALASMAFAMAAYQLGAFVIVGVWRAWK